MMKPNPKAVRKWLETPRSPTQIDGLGQSNILHILSTKEWLQAVATILKQYLEQSGYDMAEQDIAERLASSIVNWQEPKRKTPYHPLLVESWLNGDQLINQQAFLGIASYLQDTNTINETTADALEALRDYMEGEITQKKPHAMNETTQTARATLKESRLNQYEAANYAGLSAQHLHLIISGKKPFPVDYLEPLDVLLSQYGLNGLASGHVRRHCEEHSRAFNDAESFGPMLKALRDHAMLSQDSLAEKIAMNRANLSYWENETPREGKNYPSCPTKETLPKLIKALQRREAELLDTYGDAFTPLLTADNARSLTIAAYQLRGDRDTYEKVDKYTPELLAEIAVLREAGRSFSKIAKGLSLYSEHSASTTFYHSEFAQRELTPEERKAATERLALKGIDIAEIKTQLGAVHRGVSPHRDKGVDL